MKFFKYSLLVTGIISLIVPFFQNTFLGNLISSNSLLIVTFSFFGWILILFSEWVSDQKMNFISVSIALITLYNFGSFGIDSPKLQSFKKSSNQISVYQQNVLAWNENMNSQLRDIYQFNADVVCLEEFGSRWERYMNRQPDSCFYPYSYVSESPENEGMGFAVYSKYPVSFKTLYTQDSVPFLEGTVFKDDLEIQLWVVHTHSPTTPQKFHSNVNEIKIVQERIKHSPNLLKIVVGDFNSVPWKKEMKEFQELGFFNVSLFSYPSNFPLLPIDYVFYNHNFFLKEYFQTRTSSDHRGIYAVLGIENNKIK